MSKKLLFIIFFFPAFLQANTFSAWVEMGPNNSAIARVITSEKTCPNIKIDKTTQLMELRAAANTQYPVTSCEMILPHHVKIVSINDQNLVLPKSNPQRIVIIGDTGCRIKNWASQACNDPDAWPFAKIAQHAAATQPDLVIHVGDYHYRESACPFWNKGCRNSPYGYNWSAWNADFFTPAAPLLKAAPWVMVRGNHEDCQRAFEGWDRFLEPFTYSPMCRQAAPLYTVAIGDITLYIMDSSHAGDVFSSDELTAQFKHYFSQINQAPTKNMWLATHKPVWTALFPKQHGTLVTAIANQIPANIDLVIGGHVHQFEALNFAARPAQLIVGDSGTKLDKWRGESQPKNLSVNGQQAIDSLILPDFGYLVLERKGQQWLGQVHDADGKILANCVQEAKQFVCVLNEG